MKQLFMLLLTGTAAVICAGCATNKQASYFSDRPRAAYHVPAASQVADTANVGWTVKMPSDTQ